MKFLQKLGIKAERSIYRESKHVDRFLNSVIDCGEVVSIEHLYVQVKYKGQSYYIWMPDLSECLEEDMAAYIYSHLSPSVETKIRFWGWVESKSGKFSDRKEALSVRKIERLLSM